MHRPGPAPHLSPPATMPAGGPACAIAMPLNPLKQRQLPDIGGMPGGETPIARRRLPRPPRAGCGDDTTIICSHQRPFRRRSGAETPIAIGPISGIRGPKPRESGVGQGGERGPKPRQFRRVGGQNPVSRADGRPWCPSSPERCAGRRTGETSLWPHFFCRGPKPRVRCHRAGAARSAAKNRPRTGRFGVSAPGGPWPPHPARRPARRGSRAGIQGSRAGPSGRDLIPPPSDA